MAGRAHSITPTLTTQRTHLSEKKEIDVFVPGGSSSRGGSRPSGEVCGATGVVVGANWDRPPCSKHLHHHTAPLLPTALGKSVQCGQRFKQCQFPQLPDLGLPV